MKDWLVHLLCLATIAMATASGPVAAAIDAPRQSDNARPEQLYRWATADLRAGLWYRHAAAYLRRTVAAKPDKPGYHEALACALLDRALEIDAWSEVGRSQGAPPPWVVDDGPTPGQEVLAEEARKDARDAVSEMRAAVRLDPQNAELQHTLGWILAWCYQERGFLGTSKLTPEEALKPFQTAVQLAPKEARYERSLGDALRMLVPRAYRFSAPPAPDEKTPAPRSDDGSPPSTPGDAASRPAPVPGAKATPPPAASRDPVLEAYERAVELRPSDPFLHYILYGLYAGQGPEARAPALSHLQSAQRLLPSNALLSYELASFLYRLASSAPKAETRALKQSALEALRAGNRTPAISSLWIWPEYPPLLAVQLRRMPYQDFTAKLEVFQRLRSLARDASADAEERRAARDLAGAATVLEEVAHVGDRLIGDPTQFGPAGNDGVMEKLVGMAVVAITLKSLQRTYEEMGQADLAHQVEERQARLQAEKAAVVARIKAVQDTNGGTDAVGNPK